MIEWNGEAARIEDTHGDALEFEVDGESLVVYADQDIATYRFDRAGACEISNLLGWFVTTGALRPEPPTGGPAISSDIRDRLDEIEDELRDIDDGLAKLAGSVGRTIARVTIQGSDFEQRCAAIEATCAGIVERQNQMADMVRMAFNHVGKQLDMLKGRPAASAAPAWLQQLQKTNQV